MANKIAVIAIGGNSLIKDKAHQTVEDQYLAAKETCAHIADMIVLLFAFLSVLSVHEAAHAGMAYLLGDGWGIDEIQRWSKERWKSGNPREWPPRKMS